MTVWYTILHGSFMFLYILQAEAPSLFSLLSFEVPLYSEQPWMTETVSPSKAKVKFTYYTQCNKDDVLLNIFLFTII
jgi:hypothetical protein